MSILIVCYLLQLAAIIFCTFLCNDNKTLSVCPSVVLRWWVWTSPPTASWLPPAPTTEPSNSGCPSEVMQLYHVDFLTAVFVFCFLNKHFQHNHHGLFLYSVFKCCMVVHCFVLLLHSRSHGFDNRSAAFCLEIVCVSYKHIHVSIRVFHIIKAIFLKVFLKV